MLLVLRMADEQHWEVVDRPTSPHHEAEQPVVHRIERTSGDTPASITAAGSHQQPSPSGSTRDRSVLLAPDAHAARELVGRRAVLNAVSNMAQHLPQDVVNHLRPQLQEIRESVATAVTDDELTAAMQKLKLDIGGVVKDQANLTNAQVLQVANVVDVLPNIQAALNGLEKWASHMSRESTLNTTKLDNIQNGVAAIKALNRGAKMPPSATRDVIDVLKTAIQESSDTTAAELSAVRTLIEQLAQRGDSIDLLDLARKQADSMVQLQQAVQDITAKQDGSDLVTAKELDSMIKNAVSQASTQNRALISEFFDSTATKSIIANAAASGIGSLTSGLIVKSIVEAVKAPFTVASDVASATADVTQAVRNVSETVDTVAGAAKKLKDLASDFSQVISDVRQAASPPAAQDFPITKSAVVAEIGSKINRKRKPPVKIGDHSVHAERVMPQLAAELMPVEEPFFEVGWLSEWARNSTRCMSWVKKDDYNQLWAASSIASRGLDGRPSKWTEVKTLCLNTMENATVEAQEVQFIGPSIRGSLDETALADYVRGSGLVDDKVVQNTIYYALHPSDPNFIRNIAGMLTQCRQVYDNTALYAKGVHAMMVKMHAEHFSIATIPEEVSTSGITWVNMTATTIDWQQVTKHTSVGELTLVEDVDYTHTDKSWNFILALATAGSRYKVADKTYGLSARYTKWPAIPFLILGRRAMPAKPSVENISADDWWTQLEQLAKSRGELDYLLRAVIAVHCTLACDYPTNTNSAPKRMGWNFLLSPSNLMMPMPRDYNWMLRLISIKRQYDSAMNDTALTWAAQSQWIKLQGVAALSGMIRAGVATVAASFNIAREDVVKYLSAEVSSSSLLTSLINLLEESPSVESLAENEDGDCGMFILVKSVLREAFKVKLPSSLFVMSGWLGSFGLLKSDDNLQALQVYSDYAGPGYLPLRHDSILGVVNWAHEYPLEWGLSAMGTTMNLGHDFRVQGASSKVGWYAHKGSKLYEERAVGGSPNFFIPYGFIAMQSMLQAKMLTRDKAFTFKVAAFAWQVGDPDPTFDMKPEVTDWLPPFNDKLPFALFEPCTCRSFDWVEACVLVPYALKKDKNNSDITSLALAEFRDTLGIVREQVDLDVLEVSTQFAAKMDIPGLRARGRRALAGAASNKPTENPTH